MFFLLWNIYISYSPVFLVRGWSCSIITFAFQIKRAFMYLKTAVYLIQAFCFIQYHFWWGYRKLQRGHSWNCFLDDIGYYFFYLFHGIDLMTIRNVNFTNSVLSFQQRCPYFVAHRNGKCRHFPYQLIGFFGKAPRFWRDAFRSIIPVSLSSRPPRLNWAVVFSNWFFKILSVYRPFC